MGVLIINLLNKKTKEKISDENWEIIKINSWNPDVGDKIEGKLIKIDKNSNQMFYVIETNDKENALANIIGFSLYKLNTCIDNILIFIFLNIY